ncbi:unnamed protein product [Prunus armeniaca]
MEDRNVRSGMSDVVIGCVMPYLHDAKDRDAVSLVCRAMVRARRPHAQARDHCSLLHHEPRSAAEAVSAPRVPEAEREAESGDVQSDTGGLGRLCDTVGEGDR